MIWDLRNKYYFYPFDKLRINLKGFKQINIELSSVCNLNCQYCALKKPTGRKSFMDIQLYEKLLKELIEKNVRVQTLALCHSGESLVHPQFRDFVLLTRKYLDKGLKVDKIDLTTNLMLMDKKMADFIVETSVINQIVCSIDGKDKESFERLRKGANYEIVLKNFNYLVDKNKVNRNKIFVEINNGNDRESLDRKLDQKLRECFDRVPTTHYNFHNWIGDIEIKEFIPENINRGFCMFSFGIAVLSTEGKILKCCSDLNGKTAYGDFTKNSLMNIYNSKERRKYLKLMKQNKRYLVKGCERCVR